MEWTADRTGEGGLDPRLAMCKKLGIESPAKAHEMVVAGASKGTGWMLQRGLNARALSALGYSASGMARLGYDAEALRTLGYAVQASSPPPSPERLARSTAAPPVGDSEQTEVSRLKQLLESGARVTDLRREGFTIHHVKKAGYLASDLDRLGFDLTELVSACGPAELRRADYKPSELRRFFSSSELKNAGYSASDMRLAGYSVRELLNLGYNENQVRTAGYSNSDLLREGLTRTTRI